MPSVHKYTALCYIALILQSPSTRIFHFMDSQDRTCNRTWNPLSSDSGTAPPPPRPPTREPSQQFTTSGQEAHYL